MIQTKKQVNVKSSNNRKHTFEIETTTMVGHTFYSFKKNGNILLTCSEKELIKLKKLFC